MRRILVSGLAIAFLLGAAVTAFADLRPPIRRPPAPPAFGGFKAQTVKLSVEVDAKAKQARLIVPLPVMLAAMGAEVPGGGFAPPGPRLPPGVTPPKGVVPPGEEPVPPPKPKDGEPAARALPLPTIMAGLALTAAFVSGGLWMVRRGSGRTLIGVLLLVAFAGGAAILWANPKVPLPPPRPPVALPDVAKGIPVKLPANIELKEKIIFEFVPAGDTIRLLVPKSAVKDGVKDDDTDK